MTVGERSLWRQKSPQMSVEQREAVILTLRVSKAAAAARARYMKEIGGTTTAKFERGALVQFRTVIERPGSDGLWAIEVDREPGDVFEPGIHKIGYSTTVDGWYVKGTFYVIVGPYAPEDVPQARHRITEGSANGAQVAPARTGEWARTLPGNIVVPAKQPNELSRDVSQAIAKGRDALNRLILDARPLLRDFLDRQQTAVRRRENVLDLEDVAQDAAAAATIIIQNFASPARPKTTWAQALTRAVRRDISRSVISMDGESEAMAKARQWAESHPEIKDPEAAIAQWGFELAQARERDKHPDWTHAQVDEAARANPSSPRDINPDSMAIAMRPLQIKSADAMVGGSSDGEGMEAWEVLEAPGDAARRARVEDAAAEAEEGDRVIGFVKNILGDDYEQLLRDVAAGDLDPNDKRIVTLRQTLRKEANKRGDEDAVINLRSYLDLKLEGDTARKRWVPE